MVTDVDKNFMYRCIQLAKLGAGHVAPNPMVGAVLVCNNDIIGEGYHKKYGMAHAEVNAIQSALNKHPELIKKATLYVSLEPCAHYGKTPPCADLIIKHKIPKVVIGCLDSFEKVNGRGAEKLKNAGVAVETGVMQKECVQLNKRFFTFHQKKRPYIILKWAQTNDGFMAANTAQRLMISNAYTKRLVHQWRSHEAAILVGFNTALHDDPLLDNRHWFGNAPIKIVVDENLQLQTTSLKLFNSKAKVMLMNSLKEAANGNIIYLKTPALTPDSIVEKLHTQNIQSVFIEGGAKTLQAFIDAGIWDEARVITNTAMEIGEGLRAPLLKNFSSFAQQILGNDLVGFFKNDQNNFIN